MKCKETDGVVFERGSNCVSAETSLIINQQRNKLRKRFRFLFFSAFLSAVVAIAVVVADAALLANAQEIRRHVAMSNSILGKLT